MGAENSASPGLPLKAGVFISIQKKPAEPLSATVTKTSAEETWLKLARPASEPPFQEGDTVLVKYWDEGAVAFYWEAEILEISGPGNEEVGVSIWGEGMTVQRRRSYRVKAPVPLSFTVVDAADAQLNGQSVRSTETLNLSVGGVAFETDLPLRIGDKLEMEIHLPPLPKVGAVGWVVRSESGEGEGKSRGSVAVEFLQVDEEEQYQLLRILLQSESQRES